MGRIPMERRRAGPRLPVALAWYDLIIMVLALLAPLAGMVCFGAVRLWSIGPLTVALLLAAALLVARPLVFRGEFPVRWPVGLTWFLPFLLYTLIQIPFAAVPYEAWLKALMLVSGAAALVVWTALAGWGQRWRWLMAALLVAVALEAWYGIILNAHGTRAVLNLVRPEGYGMRASGTYFCPNHYAHVLALSLIVGWALLLMPRAGITLKILSANALLVVPYPLYLTQSRAGILGALAGLLVVTLFWARRRGRLRFVIALFLAPLVAAGAIAALYFFSPAWHERIVQAMQYQGGRPDLWRTALGVWREAPLMGRGGGAYRWVEFPHQQGINPTHWAQYAHNDALHIGAEYGLAGLILLLVALVGGGVVLLRAALRAEKMRDAMLAACALGVFAGSVVHAMFDYNFHIFANTHVLLMVLGVAGSVLYTDGVLPVRIWPPRRRRWIAALSVLALLGLAVGMLRAVASYALTFPAEAALWQTGNREITTRTADDAAGSAVLPVYDERKTFAGLDRAERLFDLARRLDPWNWQPCLGLGQVHKMRAFLLEKSDPARGRAEARAALPWYERALRGNPYEVAAWHGRSHLRNMQGDAEGALADLQRILQIVPRNGFFHQRLGVQLLRMGRNEDARAAFEAALKLNPADKTSRLNLQLIRMRQSGLSSPR